MTSFTLFQPQFSHLYDGSKFLHVLSPEAFLLFCLTHPLSSSSANPDARFGKHPEPAQFPLLSRELAPAAPRHVLGFSPKKPRPSCHSTAPSRRGKAQVPEDGLLPQTHSAPPSPVTGGGSAGCPLRSQGLPPRGVLFPAPGILTQALRQVLP